MNLPELQQMFRAFADVQTAEMLNLPRPRLESGKADRRRLPDVGGAACSSSRNWSNATNGIRSQKVDPEGRQCPGDHHRRPQARPRCPDASAAAPDFPDSKVNALVDNVAAIWKRTEATRGTQMVFCDMGVNPDAVGLLASTKIIAQKLIARGIPRRRSPPSAMPTPTPRSRRCSRRSAAARSGC